MTLDVCIAHAIHRDLDIVEALPGILDCPTEEIEPLVADYVLRVQEALRVGLESCRKHLENRDAASLCVDLVPLKLPIPLHMLHAMCQTIVDLYGVEARCLGETRSGHPIFAMKMTVQLQDA